MTVFIKSNEISNRNMGSILNTPTKDYALLLDFSMNKYLLKEGNGVRELTFSEALVFNRNSKATYINQSGEVKEVEAHEPRFHFDSKSGNSGILLQAGRTNLLDPDFKSGTTTVNIKHWSSDQYALYVNGSGSATISGSGLKVHDGLTATEGNPVYIKTSVTTDVTITVSGDLNQVSLTQIGVRSSNKFPRLPFPESTARVEGDSLEINSSLMQGILSSLDSFTVLVSYYTPNTPSLVTGRNNVMSFLNSSVSEDGVFFTDTETSSTIAIGDTASDTFWRTTLSNNSTLESKVFLTSVSKTSGLKIASLNGTIITKDEPYDFSGLDKFILGSNDGWQTSTSLNGILRSVVVLPYAVGEAQARELSSKLLA